MNGRIAITNLIAAGALAGGFAGAAESPESQAGITNPPVTPAAPAAAVAPVRNAIPMDFTSLPERGTVISELPPLMANGQPDWWRSLVAGNGEMGAIVFRISGEDCIVLSHEKSYLNAVKPFQQADMRPYVARARAIWPAEPARARTQPCRATR